MEFKIGEELNDGQKVVLSGGHCPDCNHRGFVLGPRGGESMNVECGGCGNRFNITRSPISPQIVFAQRIARGDPWFPRPEGRPAAAPGRKFPWFSKPDNVVELPKKGK